MSNERSERIAALNDQLRRYGLGGTIVATRGVVGKGDEFVAQALVAVAKFDQFGEDNDPYGERDFGALTLAGVRLFFKLDYYDPTLTAGSEDPADPALTHRVLTVMLAEEY